MGLDRAAERQVGQAAKVVAEIAQGEDPVYGINTGFGDLSTVRVPHDDLRALQRNLVRSHAVGVGPPLPEDVVRAILVLRANTLAAGRSGVRAEVIDLLCDMVNRRVHPAIPMHGSVGASGDLAPLAHAALVLIGEGEAIDEGKRRNGAEALKAAGLKPIELGPKEGVSLINGTQVMSAIGCLALHDAEVLATTADVVGAMSAEALRATDRAWDADLQAAQPVADRLAGTAYQVDVADPEAVDRAMADTAARLGTPRMLVNCAGILKTRPLVDSTIADWDDVARVNLSGVYYCSKAVMPVMIASKYGKMINVASVSSVKGGGQFGNVLYGTTKAGVVAMTQGFARELGPYGINVNAISPGVVEGTPMTSGLMTPEVRQRIADSIPLKRMIQPAEVARLALYLASDISQGITGQAIVLDAGFLVR